MQDLQHRQLQVQIAHTSVILLVCLIPVLLFSVVIGIVLLMRVLFSFMRLMIFRSLMPMLLLA